MRLAWHRLKHSTFARGAVTIGGGAFLAQAITLGLAPVIARLYTPEEMGLFTTYMAVVVIAVLPATLRFEQTLILPRSNRRAAALLAFLLVLCPVVALVIGLPMVVWREPIAGWLGAPMLAPWLIAAPVSVALLGWYQALRFWAVRRAAFRDIARNTVTRTGGGLGFACALSVSPTVAAAPGGGLILGQILGEGLGNIFLAWRIVRSDRHLVRRLRLSYLLGSARRYLGLALTLSASQSFATLYEKLPVLVIAFLFGPHMAGLYTWAERFAVLPAVLIGNAIGDVYRQRAMEDYHRDGRFDGLMRRTLAATTILAAVPFALGIWLAPTLFELLFGPAWREAGEFASILMVGSLVSFIVTPTDKAALICERGRFIFLWHLARLSGKVAIFAWSYAYAARITTVLWLLVGLRLVLYGVVAAYSYDLARGRATPSASQGFVVAAQGDGPETRSDISMASRNV
ncbi:lipopolysaccharide biosynthesis protein [Marinivivus vitaminiproducens]|uniref:lipopolysaccharide biosynthesis protein n=1 Tax=Marinivivus vitaminiproducens TaxID=3035935 RepID=UPI0027A1BB4B|nr:oligosaccharide flippase family protein [Geminicoccaceae bacterium SCSIO 64248]